MEAVKETVIPFPKNIPEDDSKVLQAIERFVANPPENSRVYWITPAMAKYLLDKYNLVNRPEKPGKIGEYSKSMQAKGWRLTGDNLKFSDRGLLRDGQNRLRACVESGQRFQTHIVFGVPDDFFAFMDQGKNRDGSDLLAIAHPADLKGITQLVAAAVRWATLLTTDSVKLRTTYRAPEILRLYNTQYSGVVEYIHVAQAIHKEHKWPVGFMAGMLFFLSKVDKRAADDFGRAMAGTTFTGKYASIQLLKNQLIGLEAVSSGRVHDSVRAALVVTAWNLYREGRKGRQTQFRWDPSKDFPKAI